MLHFSLSQRQSVSDVGQGPHVLQGTYYGQQGGQEDAASCGFGANFASSLGAEWTTGVQTFVAMNNPQYNNSVACGQCLMYRQVPTLMTLASLHDRCCRDLRARWPTTSGSRGNDLTQWGCSPFMKLTRGI